MGKSLKELFQTKQFADGKTLAQKYDIRNSKDAEISTATGALVVTGGVGVGGNIYATSVYDNNVRVLTQDSTVDGGTY